MKCNRLVDVGRRQFLRGGVLGAAGAAAATVLPAGQAQAQALAMRGLSVQPLGQYRRPEGERADGHRLSRRRQPRHPAEARHGCAGGAGPDGDIVAYSVLCPHKGCVLLSYNAGDKTLNCPGHFSRFDCETGGQQIWGHATQNLPQFALRVDDKGDIYADGVDELIYGRLSNVLTAKGDRSWLTSATSTVCRSSRQTPRYTTSPATTASSAAATRPTLGR